MRTNQNALNEISKERRAAKSTTFARLDRITSQMKSRVIQTRSIREIMNDTNLGNLLSSMEPTRQIGLQRVREKHLLMEKTRELNRVISDIVQ